MLRVHLGFAIPLQVTLKKGVRHEEPGPGYCSECGNKRPKVYVRGDRTLYCSDCIARDLEAARPDPAVEQRHPDKFPAEMVYDVMKLKGGTDDFELRSISAGDHPDPRLYDRSIA